MKYNKDGIKYRLCAKSNKGITLIALIVTIVVLLILAGISIASITGNSAPIDKAGQAKNETEIQAEMEEIQQAINNAGSKSFIHGNFSGSADISNIRKALKDKNLIEEDPDTAIANGKSEWEVTGSKTGAKYIIENNGQVYKKYDFGELKIGDLVNYNANIGEDGMEFTTPYTYKTNENITGSSTETIFSSTDNMKWKVLSLNNKTGEIELIAADGTPNSLELYGRTGFTNAEIVLNDISQVYGHGKGASSARSVTIEDIDQYSSYNKTESENAYSNTGYYGGTNSYISGNYFFKQIKNDKGNVIGYDNTVSSASSTEPIEMMETYYGYTGSDYFINQNAFNTLFNNTNGNSKNYWLASRCVSLHADFCGFAVRYIANGKVRDYNLFISYSSGGYTLSRAISPIVLLNKNISFKYDSYNELWNIE